MGESWPTIVVGVDGSWEALRAVSWAAREAATSGAPLHLVHGYIWPRLRVPAMAVGVGPADERRRHAEGILADAEQVALRDAPGVVVRSEIVTGHVVPVLLAASRRATLLVIGSRGLAPAGCLVAGSTTADLLGHAATPVVVVRSEPIGPQRGLVVVGFDGSPTAGWAVGVAFDIAAQRAGRVLAVQVTSAPSRSNGDSGDGAAEPLTRALATWGRVYPHVESILWVTAGRPSAVLAELSERAGLVVVGSRGQDGFADMVLGSVSHDLVHHARCPLMIVPPNASTRRMGTDVDTEIVTGG